MNELYNAPMAFSDEKCPFFWVDAFTDQPFAGNPCAVLHLKGVAEDADLLRVAKEMNLSETAFVWDASPSESQADFIARYFTPEGEIPLAGHPTLATVRTLVDAGRVAPGTSSIRLKLPAGIVNVEMKWKGKELGTIIMRQLRPQFFEEATIEEVALTFGLGIEDFPAKSRPQVVSTGTRSLMVLLKNKDSLRNLKIDFDRYRELRKRLGFFSAHLFCLEGATENGQTFARHPGSTPDIIEDPFTGSSTGAMAAYLWSRGFLKSPRFIAEQGHWMNRPGAAEVEVVGERDDIDSVKVGGSAVTLVRGEISLHAERPRA